MAAGKLPLPARPRGLKGSEGLCAVPGVCPTVKQSRRHRLLHTAPLPPQCFPAPINVRSPQPPTTAFAATRRPSASTTPLTAPPCTSISATGELVVIVTPSFIAAVASCCVTVPMPARVRSVRDSRVQTLKLPVPVFHGSEYKRVYDCSLYCGRRLKGSSETYRCRRVAAAAQRFSVGSSSAVPRALGGNSDAASIAGGRLPLTSCHDHPGAVRAGQAALRVTRSKGGGSALQR